MYSLLQAATLLVSTARDAATVLRNVELRIQDSNPLLGGAR